MLQGEHSTILSTFIKLPFVIKIFVNVYFWVSVLQILLPLHNLYHLSWYTYNFGGHLSGVSIIFPLPTYLNTSSLDSPW